MILLFFIFTFITKSFAVTLPEITLTCSRLLLSEPFFRETRNSETDLQSADQILNIPGIDLISHNTPGGLTTAKLSGTDFRHVLVRLDRVRLNSLFNGGFDLSLLDSGLLNSVKIISGSVSSLTGGDSPGGVIDFSHSDTADSFSLVSGSTGLRRITVRNNFKPDETFSFSHQEYAGDREGASGNHNSLYYKKDTCQNSFSFFSTSRSLGTPGTVKNFFWNTPFDRQHDTINALHWSFESDNLFFETGIQKSQMILHDHSMGKNNDYENAQASFSFWKRNENFLLGAEKLLFNGNAEIFSDNDFSTTWDPFVDSRNYFSARHDETSVFFEKVHKKIYISGRKDFFDDFENQQSMRVSYCAGDLLITSATGYKLPTFNDLYWPTGGNPSLRPEKNREFSLNWDISEHISATYSEMSFRDLITWAPVNAFLWLPQNKSRAQIRKSSLKFSKGSVSGEIFHSRPEDSDTDKLLLYRELSGGNLCYSADGVQLNLLWHGKMRLPDDFTASGAAVQNMRRGKLTADLKITHRGFFIQITNLTDRELVTVKDYPAQRRKFCAGITVEF